MSRAVQNARRLAQRLGHGIAHPEEELDRLQRLVVYSYDLARHGWRQLVRDNAPLMAAALAYRTLFSAVPVLVLALVVARSFYGEHGIRSAFESASDFLGFNKLTLSEGAPGAAGADAVGAGGALTQEQSQVVVGQLVEQWVSNTVQRFTGLNYSAITAISVLVFVYAAISLLVQVEQSFNTVCLAAQGRRWTSRFTNYWTILTLGSLGVGATVAISRVWIDATNRLPGWAAWAGSPLQSLGKIGIVWLLLLVAYTRMPNTRVRIRTAAVGALVAAVLWEAGKGLLVLFIRKTAGGQLEVYGPLALVPILLFWLYCTWHVVLLGLEVAWTIQTVGEARLRERDRAGQINTVDPTATVAVMRALAGAFARGESLALDQVSRETRIPENLAEQLLRTLHRAGLVHRVSRTQDDEAWALARPPETISLDRVVRAGFELTPAPGQTEAGGSGETVRAVRDRMLAAIAGQKLCPESADSAPPGLGGA